MDRYHLTFDMFCTAERLVKDTRLAFVSEDLEDALHAVNLLVETAQSAERSLVALMRSEGYTWQAIGQVLGVTRQAAQERFSPPPAKVIRPSSTRPPAASKRARSRTSSR